MLCMFSKAKPQKNSSSKGRREGGSEEEHRSRSGSPAGAGSKPTTRSKKKSKKKKDRDDSPVVKDRSYYLMDVQVVSEKLQQDVRVIKKEVEEEEPHRSDEEQVVEMTEEAACSSDRPGHLKSPAGKRRREETPGIVTDDVKLQEVSSITEGLRALLTRDECSSQLVEDVLRHCKKYERLLHKQMLENARLEGRVAALQEVNDKVDVACTAVHAAVERLESVRLSSVADDEIPAAKQAVKKTYALIVKGDKKELTPAEVRQRVGKTKVMQKDDIKIRKVENLRSGKGVVIVTQSAEDRAKVARCISESRGLKVTEPRELNPRVIVYDVHKTRTEEDLLKGITRACDQAEAQRIREEVKLVRSIIDKKEKEWRNVILEVPPDISKRLLKDRRIFCEWVSYKVAEYEDVLQCYSCHEFGHIKKNCNDEQRCWRCSRADHVAKDCTWDDESCRNCKRWGGKSDHSATSRKDCPFYQWQLQLLRARTRRD